MLVWQNSVNSQAFYGYVKQRCGKMEMGVELQGWASPRRAEPETGASGEVQNSRRG